MRKTVKWEKTKKEFEDLFNEPIWYQSYEDEEMVDVKDEILEFFRKKIIKDKNI